MIDLQQEIIPCFPQGIYIASLPNNFISLTKFWDSQKMYQDDDSVQQYGSRSENSYILDLPECQEIKDYILKKASGYANQVLGYANEPYKFTQSWITHKHPNQSHVMHHHPNSIISGIIFYGNKDSNSPAVCFESPYSSKIKIPHFRLQPTLSQNLDDNNPYTSDSLCIDFIPGTLLLFPSYLYHSVPLNTSSFVRKSLAFNTFPKNQLGEESGLTELKL